MKIEKPQICYVPDIIQLIMVSLAVKEDGLRLIISLAIYHGHFSEVEVYFMAIISYKQNMSNHTKMYKINACSVASFRDIIRSSLTKLNGEVYHHNA